MAKYLLTGLTSKPKGNKFCDFLFASLENEFFLNGGQVLKDMTSQPGGGVCVCVGGGGGGPSSTLLPVQER